jgi:hypothetical protein
MSKTPWKPWHQVVKLRDDLKTGQLAMHMFAADLYEVAMQSGKRPVYEQPEQFFALTYPTYNLRKLAKDVVLRLAGENDKAVRQLELTYGGGKTHTLITLFHLANDPAKLPDLVAVREFKEMIEHKLPRARVVAMCFDKMDVEKGIEVRAPDGKTRWLKYPWSWLAYQADGDRGLKVLSASGKSEERTSPPAEPLLVEVLSAPAKDKLGTLILIDEVLMYARQMVALDGAWHDRLVDFFQYLTQAAAKVDRCCVVASLLASDPEKSDKIGRKIQSSLYDIFQREREETVEPVQKEDVAEILRRRFFTPESILDKDAFKPHVVAALKGIITLDEQTAKSGVTAEQRFLSSYPFHPDLTDVFYAKWTGLDRFQKTRGILRTFAMALREAEKWDESPLVGSNVFLSAPGKAGLSEAGRELVTVAETEEYEGKKPNWAPILESELDRAAQIETDSVGLKYREIEQAVFSTFLHSQPIGKSAELRNLFLLVSPTRPDRIELGKGLMRWAQTSHWLDDRYTTAEGTELPKTWRLGNRPNLTQMHAEAASNIPVELIEATLLDEIQKVKQLTKEASALGVRVHNLPAHPSDVEDDGDFHYAVLGPQAACESGKPSSFAVRYLDETTGANKPRVFRNAVVLACPSKDGMEIARRRIREHLAWLDVQDKLGKKEDGKEVKIDPVRATSLMMNVDQAKKRVPESILQAYCIIVTVSESNVAQAFKLTLSDDPLFITIKEDERSRIRDTAITAETLVPGGPYDLWKEGEDCRRIKDLVGAFAQMPHLPKMLNVRAIHETLVRGCEEGAFVLRLPRPNRTFRTWWRARPDDVSLKDPAMEVVLPEKAELSDIASEMLVKDKLPGLWESEKILVKDAYQYFSGQTTVQVDRGGYQEPLMVPKAPTDVIDAATSDAVGKGLIWLLSGPSSILQETVPAGIITGDAELHVPPMAILATQILPQGLPEAWKDNKTTALSIATVLSQKAKLTLPWVTVREAIGGAIQARFIDLDEGSGTWPCDFSGAKAVKLVMAKAGAGGASGAVGGGGVHETPGVYIAQADMEPGQVQDLADAVPKLLEIAAASDVPLRFHIRVELGSEKKPADKTTVGKISAELKKIGKQMELR